ncbi:phage tail protein [Streptomyces sp. NPDC059916]|uniref:phage tail protein n=1 Tax=Streptomyces sp. NPDC059916 TaxID=3347001 RepID=UPI00368B6AD2
MSVDTALPFGAFNFSVEIIPDGATQPLCSASFSECDGLEMTLDVKAVREGGNNGTTLRLTGPAGYGQLTLKRGMTAGFDLWDWFEKVVADPSLRATGEVVVHARDHSTDEVSFVLRRCVPVKLKAPPLNAKEGLVAIEEMQIAFESLSLVRLEGGDGG